MFYQNISSGPNDDYADTGDEAEEAQLGALGMHMTGASDDDDDDDEEEDKKNDDVIDPDAPVAAVKDEEEDEEEDGVDDLKALERLAKKYEEEKIPLDLDEDTE